MADAHKVTLAEVARQAGVGLATASRALSDAPRVSPATRRRVREVADQLHFVVSPEASSLAKGTTGRVALVVPHLSRWFFGAVLEGLDSALRAADLDLLLYHVGDLRDRHDFFERLPARRKVDAVVVVAFPVEELERKRLSLMGVHVIAAGGQNVAYPHVRIDDYTAGRQAVDHLLALGHRRIAMLEAIDPDQPRMVSPRSLAYLDALGEHGLAFDPDLVVSADWGSEEGARSMGRLLSLRQSPTAVYAHSDEVAFGAMRTIRRVGLRIPADISLVGIDDHPMAETLDLTTVRQDPVAQGLAAGRMLVDLLQGVPGAHSVTLPTELRVRGSTAPPGVL